MFDEYKYRIELHAHTSPVSGCSEIPPEELVNTYKGLACDAVVITNHFTPALYVDGRSKEDAIKFYMSDFERAKAEGDRIGIKVIFGMEIRFTENSNDYLLFGADEIEATKIYDLLGDGIEGFRAKYNNPRSLFIQAHPFRNGMTEVNPALLDGIEVCNMHPNHNSRVGIAAKYASEHGLLATGGTDYHHRGHEGMLFTRTKTLPRDSYELAALLKTQDYLFDMSGFIIIPPNFPHNKK